MANQVLTMTKEGYENLERELTELITVKRVEVKEKLKEARSQGDLSENAEPSPGARSPISAVRSAVWPPASTRTTPPVPVWISTVPSRRNC